MRTEAKQSRDVRPAGAQCHRTCTHKQGRRNDIRVSSLLPRRLARQDLLHILPTGCFRDVQCGTATAISYVEIRSFFLQ